MADLGAQPVGCMLSRDFGGRQYMNAHAAESNEIYGSWTANLSEDRHDYGFVLFGAHLLLHLNCGRRCPLLFYDLVSWEDCATHQAVADELGTVREIVTRLLNRFAAAGAV
jgi:hypothetical protein